MNRSIQFARWLVITGVVMALGCVIYPVLNHWIQAGLMVGIAMVVCGWYLHSGRSIRVLWLQLVLVVSAGIPFLLPAKPIDPESLRNDYVRELQSFAGTRYVWGGESMLGIDCSGLPRRALRNALWSEGVRHANGAAFRLLLDHWWFDCSALAMRDGYRGGTRPLGVAGPLWNLDVPGVQLGDLAVRGDGGHVVVYLGNRQWIEADPTIGKVHIWTSTPSDGSWYQSFTLHRWLLCEVDPC